MMLAVAGFAILVTMALALAYALINFIGILAVLQFVQIREFRRTQESGRKETP
jgi:energy-converting hydrogenase Eha subunit E